MSHPRAWGGDLAVEDGCGDVGVEGGGLAVASCAIIGGEADDADVGGGGEGFDFFDFHEWPSYSPKNRAVRLLE